MGCPVPLAPRGLHVLALDDVVKNGMHKLLAVRSNVPQLRHGIKRPYYGLSRRTLLDGPQSPDDEPTVNAESFGVLIACLV